MFGLTKRKNDYWIIRIYQRLLNVSLISLGLVLSFFLVRELYYIAVEAFFGNTSVHDILEEVLAFFLYFVFISMIVKFFTENYHFPLRYLIYVGITGTIRFIIVNREDAMENLMLSVVILVLVCSYIMLTPHQIAKKEDMI